MVYISGYPPTVRRERPTGSIRGLLELAKVYNPFCNNFAFTYKILSDYNLGKALIKNPSSFYY